MSGLPIRNHRHFGSVGAFGPKTDLQFFLTSFYILLYLGNTLTQLYGLVTYRQRLQLSIFAPFAVLQRFRHVKEM